MSEMILYDVKQAVDQVKNTRLIVSEMRRDVLVQNVDYGVIPGTTKPTLLKPGAERLCTAFGLCPEFEPISQIEDFENGVFYYRYRCSLVHIATGKKIATGIGSCNSKEDKYRWRNEECPSCHKQRIMKSKFADRNTGEIGWYCGACKSNFPPDQFTGKREENTDPFSIINTLDKMAQKRALIAAVLIGTNASEFFTQDVEDLPHFNDDDVIEGEYTESGSGKSEQKRAQPAGTSKAQPPKSQATQPGEKAQGEPPATNGNGSTPRKTLSPDMLVNMLKTKATTIDVPVQKDERGIIESIKLEDAKALAMDMESIMDKPTRAWLLAQAFNIASCKDLNPREAAAITAWLSADKVAARRDAEGVKALLERMATEQA